MGETSRQQVDKRRLAMKLASLFVIYFCFLFCLLVGLCPAQNTGNTEMHQLMNNLTVETFVLTRRTKQCARSRFVQHKTKQLCSLPSQPVRISEHEDAFKRHISWTSSISVFILITFSSDKPLPPFNHGLYDMSPKHSSSPNTALSSINKFKHSTCPSSLWELSQTINTAKHLKSSNFEY